MPQDELSVKDFVHGKAFGIVLDKILQIRGIKRPDISNSLDENISRIINYPQKISPSLQKRILSYLNMNEDLFMSMLNAVKELLLKEDEIDSSSIDIWYIIVNTIYCYEKDQVPIPLGS